tara:strand:- start:302 stop:763 length:462 start_codon:yes stop_codon:yes gene_type:complete
MKPTYIKETKIALQLAKQYHDGQLRAVGTDMGKPYFDTHILRVTNAVSYRSRAAAALHDILEDTTMASYDLAYVKGLRQDTIEAVDLLTHGEDESYHNYIMRIHSAEGEAGNIAREVKIADLMDNFSTFPEGQLVTKYLGALHQLTEPYWRKL